MDTSQTVRRNTKGPFGTAYTGSGLSGENTVAKSRFSLSSPPLSLTSALFIEAGEAVFSGFPPLCYSTRATVRRKSRREKTGFLLQCCYSVFIR